LIQATLAALFDQHGARLYRYAHMLMAEAGAAEDAVQEAFCQLARVAVREPALLNVAYLTTIVRNECFTALRRRRRQLSVVAPLLEPAAPGSSEEERLLVESALRTLPPEQREAVYLKVFEGLTFEEIGERCNVSLNTAASRYRYALTALRASLEISRGKT
jgi:RNA polymerase sigma-70 factor (ECF subfamily)